MLERLNAYRTMWLMVLYDLPTLTKRQRNNANKFRQKLLENGFTMFQFSSYIRHVTSYEQSETQKRKIRSIIPPEGLIGVLEITDKQFERMELYYCKSKVKLLDGPHQLELF